MFSRKSKADRTAAEAWDYLTSAMAAAGESARDAGRYTAEAASSKASEFADRASKRSPQLGGKTSGKSSGLAGRASRKGTTLADRASTRVNSVADEAWVRANAAANALAGRKPGLPWALLAGFGLLGAALGWAAATTARAALERQAENEELELADTAVVVTPTYDN